MNMSTPHIVGASLIVLTLAALPASGGQPPAASAPAKPNILFIMSDDHAAHAISAYGSKINKTPNIDRIATEGMRFANCFVTNSICTPSRAAILTGKYATSTACPSSTASTAASRRCQVPAAGRLPHRHDRQVAPRGTATRPTGFDYWNILPGQGAYHDPGLHRARARARSIKGYTHRPHHRPRRSTS